MFVELHLINPAKANDLQGHPKSLEIARIDRPHDTSYQWCAIRYDTRWYINVRSKANMSQLNLPHATLVCSNSVCLSRHFFDTATFTVCVTACRAPNLEKSFTFGKQLRLKTVHTFPSMYAHSVVNTCHIH